MKIIAVGKNYRDHAIEFDGTTMKPDAPIIFMKPDSAILKNGRPFFLPDFMGPIEYEAEIVVRINNLNKNIPARFAHRYYDEITVGIDFTAREWQRKLIAEGAPWELCKGFDGAAVLGDFRSTEGLDMKNIDFRLDLDGKTVQQANSADMLFSIDEIIEYVSRYCTLKTGDLIFTGTPAGVGPVAIDNHLQGYLAGEKLLDFYVR
ncbi:MAG: fumarylacetoacetate hydrolase family protein [Bacteroidaceae bacterium]|nr:fumarylacetoacetate hydrolase family protein [Bacteroidaceae bacterium]MBR5275970.1 fumarylacetoacetate hydrolase family protein [Bacteroidaceae bacterium]